MQKPRIPRIQTPKTQQKHGQRGRTALEDGLARECEALPHQDADLHKHDKPSGDGERQAKQGPTDDSTMDRPSGLSGIPTLASQQ